MDEFAEQWVAERQHEIEAPCPAIDMVNPERPRREPARQTQPNLGSDKEIMIAEKGETLLGRGNGQRDAETAAEIFLETRGTSEAFGAVDHLGEGAVPRVHARPDLAAADAIFGDGHDR